MYMTQSEVCGVLGIKGSLLQAWLRFGFISPSAGQARGPGTRNLFTLEDICTIRAAMKLHVLGFERGVAFEHTMGISWREIESYHPLSLCPLPPEMLTHLIVTGRLVEEGREETCRFESSMTKGNDWSGLDLLMAELWVILNLNVIKGEVEQRLEGVIDK